MMSHLPVCFYCILLVEDVALGLGQAAGRGQPPSAEAGGRQTGRRTFNSDQGMPGPNTTPIPPYSASFKPPEDKISVVVHMAWLSEEEQN